MGTVTLMFAWAPGSTWHFRSITHHRQLALGPEQMARQHSESFFLPRGPFSWGGLERLCLFFLQVNMSR